MIDFEKKLVLAPKVGVEPITIVLGVMVLLTALTGLFNQLLLSCGIVICCIVLFLFDKLYLAFPFILVYNSFYGLVFGISVLRIYTLMILANIIIRSKNRLRIKKAYLLPLLVYSLYLIIVMLPLQGVSFAVYLFIDLICCFSVVNNLLNKDDAVNDFFKIYVVVCLCSFFTGIISDNFLGSEYTYSRFNATFEDPNYMGFFFTIAIFSLITLKPFTKTIRYIIVFLLYFMIMSSLSITAIVVNTSVWMIYLVATKKMKIKSTIGIVLVFLLVFSLYNYGLSNPTLPVIGDFSARISEKTRALSDGSINDFTAGRSNLAQEHFIYYLSSSPHNILFGGIPVNTRYIHPDFNAAAHNEYIDMLLNVGLIGSLVMFGYFAFNLYSYWKKFKNNPDDKFLFLVISKAVWMGYAFSFTMFLDYRFMLIFLL